MNDHTALRTAYLAAADRVATILQDSDEDTLAARVAACPDWTVHHLGAHLAGAVTDFLDGRMDGAPGPVWSARHVAERRDLTGGELATQLTSGARRLAPEVFASPSPTPVWDLLVHEGDLREALRLPVQPEQVSSTLLPVVVAFLAMIGKPEGGITISTTERRWTIGDGQTEARIDGDDYALLRILFSRRSTAQIEKSTSGDVAVVASLGIFGPRDDDQPVPAPAA